MRLAIKSLAIALLALLAAAPTSAVAAKKQKTAFSIVIEGSYRIEQFPTNPVGFYYDFRASGAIKDSGPVGGSGYRFDLLGEHATYVVFFTITGTFEIWRPTDDAWPGDLLGSGTFERAGGRTGQWVRDRWQLDGTLVGN